MSKSRVFLIICLIFISVIFIDSYITKLYIPSLYEAPEGLQTYLDRQITWQGQVVAEPDERIDKINLTLKHQEMGKVLVSVELAEKYSYGDLLEIKGKLLIPKQYDDFNYKEYLAKDRIYLVAYYPEIKLLDSNRGNFFYAQVLILKNRLRQVLDSTLLPPHSSILKAIFLGDKQSLSLDLKEKLNITGTRHIVAISGMHLVILSQLLLYLGLALGLKRGAVFYFVVLLLFLYLVLIGFPPSATRAFIFAFLLLLAQKVGRLNSADRAVVIAAALMLAINPLLLKSDIGFQLSFVAVLGIINIKPIFDNWFKKIPNPFKLIDILTLTLAAQTAVLGLLVFHFGRVSIISPIANLIIVSFLPILMVSALALSVVGLFWLGLAKLMAWPIWLLISFVIMVIECLSEVPLAAYEIKNLSWIYLLIYYLALVVLMRKFRVGNKKSPFPLIGYGV